MDINFLISQYKEIRSEYISLINLFNESEINKIIHEDEWTVAQVVSHIYKSNDNWFLYAKGTTADRKGDENIPWLEAHFLNFEEKMKSPDIILPDIDTLTKKACIEKINHCFNGLISGLPGANLEEILPTLLGDLTKWELSNFVIFHSKRHLYQIQNIANKTPRITEGR